jgi:uncharacterized OB-fold protein
MNERAIPAPSIDAESRPFYEAARQGRFLIRRCRACGRAHWHPRSLCPFCFSETDWSEASGDGEIYSYSIMRRADPPYVIAYVRLAEGPVMLTNIVGAPFEAIAVGKPVKLAFTPTDADGPPAPCFRLVG